MCGVFCGNFTIYEFLCLFAFQALLDILGKFNIENDVWKETKEGYFWQVGCLM